MLRLFRPFPSAALARGDPGERARRRRARPHQGAGRGRRAALPGRGRALFEDAARRAGGRCRASCGGRYGLASKEFTPAMVKGVLDELVARRAAPPLHGRHRRRRHAHEPAVGSRTSRPRAPACARSSSASAATARSAPRRARSDHRRGDAAPRAGLLRLRLEEVGRRSRCRTCASARSRSARPTRSSGPTSWPCHQLRPARSGSTCSERAARGRALPAEQPHRRRRGLGAPAARGAGADPRQAARALRRSTPTASRARSAWAGRINTVMQPCFFALVGRAAARAGAGRDPPLDREGLREARAGGGGSATSPRSTARSRRSQPVSVPRAGDVRAAAPRRRCRRARPTSCSA